MSDNIKVVVKVRPLLRREADDGLHVLWRTADNTICPIESPREIYTFDTVFDEKSTTDDVYYEVARPIVEATLEGINGTIFAYGQTSSGKTYTMMGDNDSAGIIPLSINHIFKVIETKRDRDFLLRVSYIEIYNDRIKDLVDVNNTELKIHEDINGQVSVTSREIVTTTPESVLTVMKKGNQNRSIGDTLMNETSSRSHSIFQITIESRKHALPDSEDDESVNVSQLNLVDLAGSERASQTGATRERLREGGHINKSLATLSLVIRQLSDTQGDPNRYVSYRDSKLTRILQNSLGGNAKTGIICAVTPATLDETHSTLKFAMCAKVISNKPTVNTVMNDATQLKMLTKQILSLQKDIESKKNLEEHNLELQEKITKLKEQILMGIGDRESIQRNTTLRRRTWCGPNLNPIPENSCQSVAYWKRDGSMQPSYKTDLNRLSNIPERDDINNSQRTSLSSNGSLSLTTKVNNLSDSDVICLDNSDCETKYTDISLSQCSPEHKCFDIPRTPPCILRDRAKIAQRELIDLVEMTNLERVYGPKETELTRQIHSLKEELRVVTKGYEENTEILKNDIDQLKQTVEKLQEENVSLKRINTDFEFQLENSQINHKRREDDLLLCLKEARGETLHTNVTNAKIYQEEIEKRMVFQNNKQHMDNAELSLLLSNLAATEHYHTSLHSNCDSIISYFKQQLSLLQSYLEKSSDSKVVVDQINNSQNSFMLSLSSNQDNIPNESLNLESALNKDEIYLDLILQSNVSYKDLYEKLKIEYETKTKEYETLLDKISGLETNKCTSSDIIDDNNIDYKEFYNKLKVEYEFEKENNIKNAMMLNKLEELEKKIKLLEIENDSLSSELMEYIQENESLQDKINVNNDKHTNNISLHNVSTNTSLFLKPTLLDTTQQAGMDEKSSAMDLLNDESLILLSANENKPKIDNSFCVVNSFNRLNNKLQDMLAIMENNVNNNREVRSKLNILINRLNNIVSAFKIIYLNNEIKPDRLKENFMKDLKLYKSFCEIFKSNPSEYGSNELVKINKSLDFEFSLIEDEKNESIQNAKNDSKNSDESYLSVFKINDDNKDVSVEVALHPELVYDSMNVTKSDHVIKMDEIDSDIQNVDKTHLQSDLNLKEEIINTLKIQISAIVSDSQRKIGELNKTIETLSCKLREHDDNYFLSSASVNIEENESVLGEIDSNETNISSLQKTISALCNEIKNKDEKLSMIEDNLKNIQEKYDNLSNDYNDTSELKNKLLVSEEKCSELDQEIHVLKDSLVKIKRELQDLMHSKDANIDEHKECINKLRSEIIDINNEYCAKEISYKEKIDSYEIDASSLQETIRTLHDELKNKDEQLNTANDDLKSVQEKYNNIQNNGFDMNELEIKFLNSEEKCCQLNRELNLLKDYIREEKNLPSDSDDLKQNLAVCKKDDAEKSIQLETTSETNLNNELEKMQSEIECLTASIESYKLENETLKKTLEELNSKCDFLVKIERELQDLIDSKDENIDEHKECIDKLRLEIIDINNEYCAKEISYKENIDGCEINTSSLQETIRTLHDEIKNKDEQLNIANDDLKNVQEKYNNIQNNGFEMSELEIKFLKSEEKCCLLSRELNLLKDYIREEKNLPSDSDDLKQNLAICEKCICKKDDAEKSQASIQLEITSETNFNNELERMHSETECLTASIESYKLENETLMKTLEELNSKCDSLVKIERELQDLLHSKDANIDEYKECINKLQLEIVDNNNNYAEKEMSYKEKIDSCEINISSLQETICNMQDDIKIKNEQLCVFENDLRNIQEKYDNLNNDYSDMNELKSKFLISEEKCHALEQEIQSLKDSIAEQKDLSSEYDKSHKLEIESLMKTLKERNLKYDSLAEMERELQNLIISKDLVIDDHKECINKLRLEAIDNNKDYAEKETSYKEKIDSYEINISSLQETICTMRDEIKIKDEQLGVFEDNLKDIQRKYDNLSNDYSVLSEFKSKFLASEEKCNLLDQEIQSLKDSITEQKGLSSVYDDLKEDLILCQNVISEKENMIEKLQILIETKTVSEENLNDELKKVKSETECLTTSIESYKLEIESLMGSLDEANSKCKSLAEMEKELQNLIISKDLDIDEHKECINKLRSEVLDNNKDYAEKEMSYKEKIDCISSLQETIGIMRDEIKIKDEQLGVFEDNLKDIQRKYDNLSNDYSVLSEFKSKFVASEEKCSLLDQEIQSLKDSITKEKDLSSEYDNIKHDLSVCKEDLIGKNEYIKTLTEKLEESTNVFKQNEEILRNTFTIREKELILAQEKIEHDNLILREFNMNFMKRLNDLWKTYKIRNLDIQNVHNIDDIINILSCEFLEYQNYIRTKETNLNSALENLTKEKNINETLKNHLININAAIFQLVEQASCTSLSCDLTNEIVAIVDRIKTQDSNLAENYSVTIINTVRELGFIFIKYINYINEHEKHAQQIYNDYAIEKAESKLLRDKLNECMHKVSEYESEKKKNYASLQKLYDILSEDKSLEWDFLPETLVCSANRLVFENQHLLNSTGKHEKNIAEFQSTLDKYKYTNENLMKENSLHIQKLKDKHEECKNLQLNLKTLEEKLGDSKLLSKNSSPLGLGGGGGLMDFFVDKMTHDLVQDKNKQLQKSNEELRIKNKELIVEIRRLQHSLQNNTLNNFLPNDRTEIIQAKELLKQREAEIINLKKIEKSYEELKIQYKEMDEEYDVCVKLLREKEDDCRTIYAEKKILEARNADLEIELKDNKENSLTQKRRAKRQSLVDMNRGHVFGDLNNSDSGNLSTEKINLMVDRSAELEKENKLLQKDNIELKAKNNELANDVVRLKKAISSTSKKPEMTVACQVDSDIPQMNSPTQSNQVKTSTTPSYGSAILLNQKLCEYMDANHKQKSIIDKLKTVCRVRDLKIKELEAKIANK